MSGQTVRSRRPTKVKVLTITYDIKWLSEDEWYRLRYDDHSIGVTSRDQAQIAMRADSTASEESLKTTLCHELFHCCTQSSRIESNLSSVEDGEEFFISIISPLFLHVLQNNPAVTKYLLNR